MRALEQLQRMYTPDFDSQVTGSMQHDERSYIQVLWHQNQAGDATS
jgi:hypothetical protein